MFFFRKKRKKSEVSVKNMMPWEEIVEFMYNKGLSFTEDQSVIKVIYSKDKTKRFVVLKSNKGFYTYRYENLFKFDEDEWKYICNTEDAEPAYWGESSERAKSFCGTEEDVINCLVSEPEYLKYFK